MIKKIISTALIIGLLATNASLWTAFASEKLPTGSEKLINSLVSSKIMSVYQDGTFRPSEIMTREKLARFINAALKYRDSSLGDYDVTKNYSSVLKDLKSTDFYFPYIASMYDKGIIKWYSDNTFKGKKSITRGEAITMLIRAYKQLNYAEVPDYVKNFSLLTTLHKYNDVTSSHPFYNSIYFALENEFIVKNPSFRPNDTISKYEIAVLMYRMLLDNWNSLKDIQPFSTDNENVSTNSVIYKWAKVRATNATLTIANTKLVKLAFNNDSKFAGKLPYVNKANIKVLVNSGITNSVSKVSLISRNNKTITYGLILTNSVVATDKVYASYEDSSFKISANTVPSITETITETITDTNTGSTNTGSTNTGSTNTGSTNTGSTNTGSTNVSLATDNPAYQFVPNNATNVELLKTTFEVANNTTMVSNIIVKRTWLWSSSDIKYVKLYINGVKAWSDRTFNSSDDKVTFYVPTSMQKLSAGKNSIVIKADFNGVSNSLNKVQLESISSIVSSEAITGTFPIVGNDVQTAGIAAGVVNFTTYAWTNGTYYIGDVKKEMLKFDLAATSVESAYIKSLRFRLSGSARITDFSNLSVYDSDNKVVIGSGTVTSDGYITFDLVKNDSEGYFLEKGITKTFYLKWDIVSGRSNSTLTFDIENPSDIFAIGKTYKFGVSVTETSSSTAPSAYTIKGGKLSVSLAQDSASAKDIAPRTNNIQLAKFNFTTQWDAVNIQKIRLLVIANDNHTIYNNTTTTEIARVSNIENLKIVVGNNSFVYWPIDLLQPSSDITYSLVNDGIVWVNHSTSTLVNNGTDMQIINIDDDFILPSNTTTPMVVTVNLNTNASKSDTYQIKLLVTKSDGTSLIVGENDITQDNISSTDITPSGANTQIAWNLMTIDTAKVTTSLKAVPGSKTISKNSKQTDLFGFTMAAWTASDLKLNSIKISRDSDLPTSSISDLENLNLYVGDKKISGSIGKSFVDATIDYVLFDDLRNDDGTDFKLTAWQQYDFLVKADVSSNAIVGNKWRFYIASANDINITDSNSQTLFTSQKIFGDIVVNSVSDTQAPIFTIQQGWLSVAVDNSTPVKWQLTAGETAKSVFTFKLSARNEDVYIKTLRLKANTTPGNVYRLELFDGSTGIGGGAKTVISGVATWSLSNTDRIKITAGSDKIITVKADIMTSDNSIAQSGGDFTVSLDSSNPLVIESESGNSQPVVGYKTTTTRTTDTINGSLSSTQSNIITTVGQASWVVGDIIKIDNEEILIVSKNSTTSYNVVRGINGTTSTTHLNNANVICYDSTATTSIVWNVFTVYYILPTEISAATLPTTTLQAWQEQVVGAFKVKASANTDTTSNKLTLKNLRVSKAWSVQVSNIKLYNKLDSSIYVNGVFTSWNKVEFNLTGLTGGKNEITEWTEAVFEIKAMVDYVPAGSTLSMNINDIAGSTFTDSDFGWSDGVGNYYNIKLSSDTINGNVLSTSAQNPVGTTTDWPTVQSVVFNGTADDKFSNNDTVVVTWNEAIDPSTILTTGSSETLGAGRTVTNISWYLARNAAGTSVVTIPNIWNIIVGGDTSVNGAQTSSTVSLSLDSTWKILTITVTSAWDLTGTTTAESFTSSTPSTTTVKNINGQYQKNTAVTPTWNL